MYRKPIIETCIHEAGHALLVAYSNNSVHDLHVDKSGEQKVVIGSCTAGPSLIEQTFLKWNEDEKRYDANREKFEEFLLSVDKKMRGFVIPSQRNHLAILLAGFVAELIFRKEKMTTALIIATGPKLSISDESRALGVAKLIAGDDFEKELSNAKRIATTVLKKNWSAVERVAAELNKHGRLDGDRVHDLIGDIETSKHF